MSQFRSILMAQKWATLHQQRQELMNGKVTPKVEDKIDLLISIMSSCKVGFTLTDAKIKKSIKFIKQHTGKLRVKYGSIPSDVEKINTILFNDVVLKYGEKNDQIFFREHKEEQ